LKRDIIVIGGSAGALEVLYKIVQRLPHDISAAMFVVIHLSASRESLLPGILSRAGRLPATHPTDRERIDPRTIYVAPPDRLLIIEKDYVATVHGPKENRARPAIDPLFRSAALAYGARVIGVVLSGALDDGAAGLNAIKKSGGVAIVQDPAEAAYPSMPHSAIDNTAVDFIVRAEEIAPLLRSLVSEEVSQEEEPVMSDDGLRKEMDIVRQGLEPEEMIDAVNDLGRISMFTCRECHGALWELTAREMMRYRCHLGHAFSIESLAAEQSEKLQDGLWSALRALE